VEVGQLQRADPDPYEAPNGRARRLEHAPDLTLPALGQDDAIPAQFGMGRIEQI
jgi:hypothetical protein